MPVTTGQRLLEQLEEIRGRFGATQAGSTSLACKPIGRAFWQVKATTAFTSGSGSARRVRPLRVTTEDAGNHEDSAGST